MPGRKLPFPKTLVVLALIVLISYTMAVLVVRSGNDRPWSALMSDLQEDRIERIQLGQDRVRYHRRDDQNLILHATTTWPGANPTSATVTLLQAIDASNARRLALPDDQAKSSIEIDGEAPSPAWGLWLFNITLLGLIIFFIVRSVRGGPFGFKPKKAQANNISVNLADVGGVAHAKEEIGDVLQFLKNPSAYQEIGVRVPKGILLVGPPGTGKTLLARAMAKEVDAEFLPMSGSEFIEMFVGVGASRVRNLFRTARKAERCIIFIDEIDAIAGRRSGDGQAAGKEHDQTLNQILVEMDGFSSNDRVVVLAATNRVDILDKALLRPGRFDRHIHVDLPSLAEREEIADVHLRGKRCAEAVSADLIARLSPGFSGADIANLLNESGLIAARRGATEIGLDDMYQAKDRVLMGQKRILHLDTHTSRRIAIHELGHAIVGAALPSHRDRLERVSIIPRGGALGVTLTNPDETPLHPRSQLIGDLAILLAGREAERQELGEVSSGASSDLERVEQLASSMAMRWGMGSDMLADRAFLAQAPHGQAALLGPGTLDQLDEAIGQIIAEATSLSRDILQSQAAALQSLCQELIDAEELPGDRIRDAVRVQPQACAVTADTVSSPA